MTRVAILVVHDPQVSSPCARSAGVVARHRPGVVTIVVAAIVVVAAVVVIVVAAIVIASVTSRFVAGPIAVAIVAAIFADRSRRYRCGIEGAVLAPILSH